MMINEQNARAWVIEAGHRLVEEKLIARTWGNISARISPDCFVITPSGRSYDTLRPEDLVMVSISDLSYAGNVKPSSEKGIHAAAYTLRPECQFVIHTHQLYASAISAEGKDTEEIPCAAYGLPGTGKLRDAVRFCIESNPDKKAFLMAHHGVVCLGKDYEDAFQIALNLEKKCKTIVEKRISDGQSGNPKRPWLDDYAQLVGFGGGSKAEEDREAIGMVKEKNSLAARYVRNGSPLSFPDAVLQRLVYRMKYSKLKNK